MLEDKEILELIAKEETFERGFKVLVVQFQEQLYWHVRRMVHFHEDADDVLQNVFIKVFKNIKGFEQKSKLYTWLYRIASNESISFLRKKKRLSLNSLDELESLKNNLLADQYFDADKANLSLSLAIATLPEKQKLVFNMRYYDEMSYKDIADITEVSIGALKASYHHAMKKVESYLKKNVDYV